VIAQADRGLLELRAEHVVSYRDRINQAVEAMGSQLGFKLSLDSGGAVALTFDNARSCQLVVSDTDERVALFAPIAEVHADTRGPLFEAALRLNFDAARTDGGILGYDANQREIVLTTNLYGELDVDRLAGALNDFMRSALALREKLNNALQSHRPAQAGAATAENDLAASMMKV
jgi:hypothetical protein